MGKLNINGGGVDTNKKMADIDERFGPYTSTEAADAALGGQGRNTITAGLTVGILTANAGVKEYWYQPNKKTGQLGLIPKGGNAADNPTEGNFASFDENGNVVDSGCNEGSFIKGVQKNGDDLTPDFDGKVNVEVQDGKSAYQLYVDEYKEAHSGSTEGMLDDEEWLDSLDAYGVYVKQYDEQNPEDTEHSGPDFMSRDQWLEYIRGKSAREIYNQEKGTDYDDARFIEAIKSNYPMKYVAYNETAYGATSPFDSIGSLDADETTEGKLWFMPNSDNTETKLFITVNNGTAESPTYKWYNMGVVDMPSNVLTEEMVDNECVDGATDEPASAKAVMQLKAKLEGVTASEVKVTQQPITGSYVKGGDGTIEPYSNTAYLEIALGNTTKSVRFLGCWFATSYSSGYAFGHYKDLSDSSTWVNDKSSVFDANANVSGTKEYVIEVPEGATHFRTTTGTSVVPALAQNFYCYLQSGTSVGKELADKASYSEMEGLWRYQKNLFNVDEFESKLLDYSQTSEVPDSNGKLSNKLYLENGVTYTASNVVCSNTTNKYVFFSAYDANGNLLGVRSFPNTANNAVIDTEGSGNYRHIAHVKFVYDENWYPQQEYIRIQIRNKYQVGDYTKAQLEVGDEATAFAEYNSVKEFDIAKESSLKQVQENVDGNTGRIESLESQIGVNEYQVDLNTISRERYVVDSTTGNYVSTQGNGRSSVIPILKDKGNIINITANSNQGFMIAFLSDEPTVGSPLPFAVGYPYRIQAAKGKTDEFEIVHNETVKYLYILRNNTSGTDTSPAEICYVDKKELNILAIGNSNDITELAYVPPILQQLLPNYHINLYVAYVGFGTIKDHLYMYDNNIAYNGSGTTVGDGVTKNAYVYCWRYGRYYETKLTGIKLEELLTLHKWDIVKFITQRSDEYALVKGTYDDDENHNGTTKEQFITNCKKLLNILRSKLNYGFKFVTNIGGVAYTQESDYIGILKEGCKILKKNVGVDFIIPDSLATTIARGNNDLATISGGKNSLLFSDNNHLNAGFPCLLTAYTAIDCILRNLYINKSIYNSTLWIPTNANAIAIGAQDSNEPNPGSNRKMTYGVSLGIEEDGEIIQSNILAAKEIAVIANNIIPDLPEDDYILPPFIHEPASEEENESE